MAYGMLWAHHRSIGSSRHRSWPSEGPSSRPLFGSSWFQRKLHGTPSPELTSRWGQGPNVWKYIGCHWIKYLGPGSGGPKWGFQLFSYWNFWTLEKFLVSGPFLSFFARRKRGNCHMFALEVRSDSSIISVKNLSASGTLLNGAPLSNATLQDGDWLFASWRFCCEPQ